MAAPSRRLREIHLTIEEVRESHGLSPKAKVVVPDIYTPDKVAITAEHKYRARKDDGTLEFAQRKLDIWMNSNYRKELIGKGEFIDSYENKLIAAVHDRTPAHTPLWDTHGENLSKDEQKELDDYMEGQGYTVKDRMDLEWLDEDINDLPTFEDDGSKYVIEDITGRSTAFILLTGLIIIVLTIAVYANQ